MAQTVDTSIIGRTLGRLTVLSFDGIHKKHGSMWLCRCSCGNEKVVSRNGLNGNIKSCGCLRRPKDQFGAYGSPVYNLLARAKQRARRDGLEFNLTYNDIVIPEKCPLLGTVLLWGKDIARDESPSLDRLDNSKGYVKGNVWVISHRANTIKNSASIKELETLLVNLKTAAPSGGSKLVYIASPYTHPDVFIREERYRAVVFLCGRLMNQYPDTTFFSPIVHAHFISTQCIIPVEWEYWAKQDECMISRCEEVWVFCISGWNSSVGVAAERLLAVKYNLPIRFLSNQDEGFILTTEEPLEAHESSSQTDGV